MISPEFMTPGQAQEALGIKSPKTLRKLRKAKPELAIMLPGMGQWRYVKSRILALTQEGHRYGRSNPDSHAETQPRTA